MWHFHGDRGYHFLNILKQNLQEADSNINKQTKGEQYYKLLNELVSKAWLVVVLQERWQRGYHGTVLCLWRWCWLWAHASYLAQASSRFLRWCTGIPTTTTTGRVMRYTWFVRERHCKQSVRNAGTPILLKRIHISMTPTMFSLAWLSGLTPSRVDRISLNSYMVSFKRIDFKRKRIKRKCLSHMIPLVFHLR